MISIDKVNHYLAALDPPRRDTLQALRETILQMLPDAEQIISYQIPAFRLEGEVIAGSAAFTRHLSYLPFSGSVLPKLERELAGFTRTKSPLHFSVEHSLPTSLAELLIALRPNEAQTAT